MSLKKNEDEAGDSVYNYIYLIINKYIIRIHLYCLYQLPINMSSYGERFAQDIMSHTRLSNKEVAAFDFISEMCSGYEYFDDCRLDENFVMSDHDIERDNEYSHNLKVSICNYLEDEGILKRKKEDDGFHICKHDIFIKYVVGHMATKGWPKKELLKYVNHYCKNGKQMGKLIMEAGNGLPVRTMQGDCKNWTRKL